MKILQSIELTDWGLLSLSQIASRNPTKDNPQGYIGLLPLCRSKIKELERAGKFPKGSSLGEGQNAKLFWRVGIIREFAEALAEGRVTV